MARPAELSTLAQEVISRIHELKKDSSPELRRFIDSIEVDAVELAYETHFAGAISAKFAAKIRKKLKAAAEGRVRRKADKLRKMLKNTPKYRNPQFKCIADYDLCRTHRGPYSTVCAMAFFACIFKGGIPGLKELTKLLSRGVG
jgi:hypothetical protein